MAANDDAWLDRVDGCAVAGDDVDAEVKRGELTFGIQMEARIAERSANRVRLVERLHGPAVRGCNVRDRQREREHKKRCAQAFPQEKCGLHPVAPYSRPKRRRSPCLTSEATYALGPVHRRRTRSRSRRSSDTHAEVCDVPLSARASRCRPRQHARGGGEPYDPLRPAIAGRDERAATAND